MQLKNLGNNNISTTNDIIYTPAWFPSNSPLQENPSYYSPITLCFLLLFAKQTDFSSDELSSSSPNTALQPACLFSPHQKGKTYQCHDQIHSTERSFSLLCLTVLTLCLPFQLNCRNFKDSSSAQVNGYSPRGVLRLSGATIPKSLRIFFSFPDCNPAKLLYEKMKDSNQASTTNSALAEDIVHWNASFVICPYPDNK